MADARSARPSLLTGPAAEGEIKVEGMKVEDEDEDEKVEGAGAGAGADIGADPEPETRLDMLIGLARLSGTFGLDNGP